MHETHKRPRFRPSRFVSYANVVSTLALVIAVGGGSALAVTHATTAKTKPKPKHHYVISSTSQISPSVLGKLHGAAGPQGTPGTSGTSGAAGATGATGDRGPSNAWLLDTSVGSGTTSTVPLPAGSYVVGGEVYFNAPTNPSCTVGYSVNGQGQGGTVSYGLTTMGQNTLPVAYAFTTTTPATFTIECTAGGGGAIGPVVTITQVATLTTSQ